MTRTLCLPLAVLVLPGTALAHGGHAAAGPLASGLIHPFSGADHLLAMTAVGIWAAMTGGRALWAFPLAFMLALLAGGAIGASGAVLPGVEPAILGSVIVLGALIALAARLPMAAALVLASLFGAAHGIAHGAEGPAAGFAAYALGFVAATGSLHGVGLVLGRALARLPQSAARGAGVLTLLAGAVLAVAP